MGVFTMWPSQGTTCKPRVIRQVETLTTGSSEPTTSDEGLDTSPHRDRLSSLSHDESDSDAETTYICPCGKKFTRSTAYQRHLDVAHSSTEIYKCSICSKTFGNERTLTMHMSVHQDSKQFTSTIERCSKSKNGSKIRSSRIVHKHPGEQNKTTTCVTTMNLCTAKSNVSIKSINGSQIDSEDIPQSSQDSSREPETTSCSEDDSVGTDKENCSPKHTTSVDCVVDPTNLDTVNTIDVPPLVNGKYHATSDLDLDLTLAQLEEHTAKEESIIVSNSAKVVTKNSFVVRHTGNKEPNKVSFITIKTDRSLLSESLLRSKGPRAGEFMVSPTGHSVIVIKTQSSRTKFDATKIKLEPDEYKTPEYSIESNQNDESSLVRKSQRLQGKVPGWKQILVDQEICSSSLDLRGKRRRMIKIKQEDEMTNGMGSIMRENVEVSLGKNAENISPDEMCGYDLSYKRPKLSSPGNPCAGVVKTGVFKCPVCEKSFESEKYLSMHMSLHKVDNSMESLMSQNNKDDEVDIVQETTAIKPGTINSSGHFWTCKICNKVFAQNSNYKNHIRTHSDERPFVCQICSIGFKERYHLKKHMLFKHSNELKEECRVCGKKFKDSTAVRAHERIHSDVRPYSCRRCGKSFKTSECLWHHENRSKTCGQALLGMPAPSGPRFKRGRQPKKEPKFTKDQATGYTVFPVTCNGQRFFPAGSLLISGTQQVVHTPVTQTISQMHFNEVAAATASIQSPQPAELVPVTTVRETQLVKLDPCSPESTQTSTPEMMCTSIKNQSSLSLPLSSAPIVSQQPITSTMSMPNGVYVKVEPQAALPDYELTAMASEGSFDDSKCEMHLEEDPDMPPASLIESESGIEDISHEAFLHVQAEIQKDPVLEDIEMLLLEKHAGQGDLSVDEDEECIDFDEDYTDLTENMTQQEENKHLSCDKCGKQFNSVPAFEKHMVTHSGLRPYMCNLCGVGFKLKVHLKKHFLYRHSDEKPCECSICGKKFKDSSAVKLHERIHSDSRPFHCECGKTFKTRENLWGHRHRGPCEKMKYDNDTVNNLVTLSSQPPFIRAANSANSPIYAHAQLGDTHVSAHAAISNNQIIARAYVSNSQVTAEAMIGDNGEVKATASISGSNAKFKPGVDSAEKAAIVDSQPVTTTNTQYSVPTCVAQRSEGIPIILSRPQEARVALPVLYSSPSTTVPTAVVAPLKREPKTLTLASNIIPPQSILKPIKADVPKTLDRNIIESNTSPKLGTEFSDKVESALPPFETFSPKLRSQTMADRCPTIQRYLQMAQQPIKLPGIQQLFQTHSLTGKTNPTEGIPQSIAGQMPIGLAQSLLPIRRPDPSAPLGPHPTQIIKPDMTIQTFSIAQPKAQSLLTLPAGMTRFALRPPNSIALTPTEVPTNNVQFAQTRFTPTPQMIRSASPYPGLPGLPLLLPSDPNLASTSGEGLPVQSPADPSMISAATTAYWDEEMDKKSGASMVWQTEQEQLFQDLTQSTVFGQL